MGQFPAGMPDRERIVGNKAFFEYLAIPLARQFGFRKVVGKVRAYELLAPDAGDLYGGFVDVGYFSFRADRDQRVEARLDQASGILGRLPLFAYIAGSRKNAQDIACHVLVHGGVVQDMGQFSAGMPDRERIVGNKAFFEYLAISLARQFGFRKVVRKVRADELLAPDAGDLYGGFVDIGNFSFRADRHQRVKARLDQAPGICGCFSQLFGQFFASGAKPTHL